MAKYYVTLDNAEESEFTKSEFLSLLGFIISEIGQKQAVKQILLTFKIIPDESGD